MTHTDPASPQGGRKDEDTIPMPDDSDRAEESTSGGTSAGDRSTAGPGAGGAGTTGGASDEFLGVEKDFWMRLLYIIAAGFVAWVSFWFIIILAVAQIIYRLAAARPNEDLRGFTRNMIQYLHDLLGFVTLVHDERPFLFGGKFPDTKSEEFHERPFDPK